MQYTSILHRKMRRGVIVSNVDLIDQLRVSKEFDPHCVHSAFDTSKLHLHKKRKERILPQEGYILTLFILQTEEDTGLKSATKSKLQELQDKVVTENTRHQLEEYRMHGFLQKKVPNIQINDTKIKHLHLFIYLGIVLTRGGDKGALGQRNMPCKN